MLDAFGKPGSNLKNYQIKWLGAYEECLATEAKDYYYTKDGLQSTLAKFSGRYCAVSIPLEQGSLVKILTHICLVDPSILITWTISFPICFIFILFKIEIPVGKQWRPWSDAAFWGVWSGSALFAYVPNKGARLLWVKLFACFLSLLEI